MTLKWSDKSKDKKVCHEKSDISYIQEYKDSHNRSRVKIPSEIVFERKNILLGILRKRQRLNEIKTIRAVENCRRLVLAEIENFFEQQEGSFKNFLPEIISGKRSYAHILDNNDLETIYKETENIILNALSERFKSLIVWRFKRNDLAKLISDSFTTIQKYQKTKKRTVLITSCMEALAKRSLSDSINLLMKNSLISKFVDIDISTIILPELGIDANLEIRELNKEVINRISGALYSIKKRLTQEINHQIANIFYATHDLQLDAAFELKICSLEETIAHEIYETDLLEA
ncbi:MAG: hypothetical protein P4L49_12775 [Desulfosporosinus sp.]|nr:hypothetical protein [Desulfosporosinus sp.]